MSSMYLLCDKNRHSPNQLETPMAPSALFIRRERSITGQFYAKINDATYLLVRSLPIINFILFNTPCVLAPVADGRTDRQTRRTVKELDFTSVLLPQRRSQGSTMSPFWLIREADAFNKHLQPPPPPARGNDGTCWSHAPQRARLTSKPPLCLPRTEIYLYINIKKKTDWRISIGPLISTAQPNP